MLTMRNVDLALPLSARTATADLVNGMIVAFVAGSASGEQPLVRKATSSEIADATVVKGIVDYVQPDSQDVDFNIDVVNQTLTSQSKVIPQNAQVVVWMGTFLFSLHDADLPNALKSATVREPAKIAFSSVTNLPAVYASGATDGTQIAVGIVYRVDAPEVTFLVTL